MLDKTGTVTEGTPAVTEVVPLGGAEAELLEVAAAVEAVSAHPLAAAITAYARENGFVPSVRPEDFENLSGRGLRARLDGAEVLAGNRRLLEEGGVDVSALAEQADRLAAQGQTPMYFARDGRLLGLSRGGPGEGHQRRRHCQDERTGHPHRAPHRRQPGRR